MILPYPVDTGARSGADETLTVTADSDTVFVNGTLALNVAYEPADATVQARPSNPAMKVLRPYRRRVW